MKSLLPSGIAVILAAAAGYFAGRSSADVAGKEPVREGQVRAAAAKPEVRPAMKALEREEKYARIEGVPEDLEKQLRTALKQSSSTRRLLHWNMALEEMTPESARGVLAMFDDYNKQGIHYNQEYEAFWRRWAEVDGPVACAAIFKQDERFEGTGLSNLTIAGWTALDPAAAVAWLSAQEDIPLKSGMWEGVARGVASAEPAAAMSLLKNLPPQLNRNRILHGVADGVLYSGGADALKDWYRNLPDKEAQATVLAKVTSYMTGVSIPETLDWISETTAGNREAEARELIKFGSREPGSTLEYLATAPAREGVDFNPAIQAAIHALAKSNPNAAAPLLTKIRNSPRYDTAVAAFAGEIQSTDFEAAQKWAETIRDPAMKRSVMESLQQNAKTPP